MLILSTWWSCKSVISPVGTSEINKRSGDVFLRKKKNLNPVFVWWGFLKCGFKKNG